MGKEASGGGRTDRGGEPLERPHRDWRGREVTSAIWKSPVGRVPVRGVNVSGDDPANGGVHGGIDMAVYSCRSTDYGWWAPELAEDLAPGTFGRT